MLYIKKTNLWDDVNRDSVIVHGANTGGRMGAGFARELRERYPDNYRVYHLFCNSNKAVLGELFVHWDKNPIINLFSQHIYQIARLDKIEEGLQRTLALSIKFNFTELLSPAIGCGIGGLDWKDVLFLYKNIFEKSHIKMTVYRQENKYGRI